MSAIFILCSVLMCSLCVHALQEVKVLYCQDPDTGILHPVNTTWPSQTFCGNYICKLRKKNDVVSDPVAPVRKINITNININFIKSEEDLSPGASENFNIGMRINPDLSHLLNEENFADKKVLQISNQDEYTDNDRYLTESEIKIITDMLHSVKKSDLEAIIEVYNLAQDIYKEYDQNESLLQDTMTPIHTHGNTYTDGEVKDKPTASYWYEPFIIHNAKIKPDNANNEVTTTMGTTKSKDSINPFYKGTLTNKDFRKLPYYYPISRLQKMTSDTQSEKTEDKPQIQTVTEKKPCQKQVVTNNNYSLPPWLIQNLKHPKPNPSAAQEPTLLLPFPFAYVNNNNLSGYPTNVFYGAYSGYPWAQMSVYDRNRHYQQSYLGTAFVAQVPNEAAFVKAQPEVEEPNREDITKEDIIDLISQIKDKELKKMPEWQTSPLSAKVIEEIRGNAEKPKLINPLRKKINLERVDKVIKIDEIMRSKRNTDDFKESIVRTDDAETYLTTITCQPSTELGYFRRGNMSRQFPACCPERIETGP